MEILGYSERGIINSFFYEMALINKSTFQSFLKLIKPLVEGTNLPDFEAKESTTLKIIIEPSFSEFGDSDAVILFEDKNLGNTVLFIEAKVCKRQNWNFEVNVLNKLCEGIKAINSENQLKLPSGYSSNLMIQLYHKYKFIQLIYNNKCLPSIIDSAISCPISPNLKSGEIKCRSIGEHEIVKKIEELLYQHLDCCYNKEFIFNNVYYIAIIPSDKINDNSNLPLSKILLRNAILSNQLKNNLIEELYNIETDMLNNLGYITWYDIHKLAYQNKMNTTIKVFDLNQCENCSTDKLFNQIFVPKNSIKCKNTTTQNQIYNPEQCLKHKGNSK